GGAGASRSCEQGRRRAVEPAGGAPTRAGRARCLDPDEPDAAVVDEPAEEADRIRTAADAGDRDLRQAAFRRKDLLSRLAADHGLEAGDDLWVRGRPDAGTDQVVRRLDVPDPVADCLACRFLARLRPP